jgi:hypothetical protein
MDLLSNRFKKNDRVIQLQASKFRLVSFEKTEAKEVTELSDELYEKNR